jgi:hypothetical protein
MKQPVWWELGVIGIDMAGELHNVQQGLEDGSFLGI